MDVSLSPELEQRVETEIESGDFQTSNQLIEEAIRQFLDARRARRRLEAVRRIGDAVDAEGLYDRVHIPPGE